VTVTQSVRLLLDDLTNGLAEEWTRRPELSCGSNAWLNASADEERTYRTEACDLCPMTSSPRTTQTDIRTTSSPPRWGTPTDAANLRKSGIAVLTKLGGRRPVFSRAQLT
jgi:hypothetical protein